MRYRNNARINLILYDVHPTLMKMVWTDRAKEMEEAEVLKWRRYSL